MAKAAWKKQHGKDSMASHVTVPALTAEWKGKAGVEWRKAWQATCRPDRIVFKCNSQFINSRLRAQHWLALNPIAAENDIQRLSMILNMWQSAW